MVTFLFGLLICVSVASVVWVALRSHRAPISDADAAQRKEKQWKRDYEASWMQDCADDWLAAHKITGIRAWWWKTFK